MHRIKGDKRVAEGYLFRVESSLLYRGVPAGFAAILGDQVDLYGSEGSLITQIKIGILRSI